MALSGEAVLLGIYVDVSFFFLGMLPLLDDDCVFSSFPSDVVSLELLDFFEVASFSFVISFSFVVESSSSLTSNSTP